MKLKWSLYGGEVRIYREKWGTLLFMASMGVVTIAFAALFFWLQYDSEKALAFFPELISILFAVCGTALLLRLPSYAKKIFDADGANLVIANSSGLSVTTSLALPLSILSGLPSLKLCWLKN